VPNHWLAEASPVVMKAGGRPTMSPVAISVSMLTTVTQW
jgi:hypothetical protein